MYTLRRIHNRTEVEANRKLGESYTVVLREHRTGTEFNKALAIHFGVEVGEKMPQEKIDEGNSIYGFIFDENGKMNVLYEKDKYYIMTESGKTFCNLSLKA